MIDVSKRILQRGTLKKPDRPVTVEAFMNQFFTITKAVLSKQLRLPIIGIPAAMFDPSTQKIILPGHKVGIRTRSTIKHQSNLFLQLWGHSLIAFQTEDPFMGRECDSFVAQSSESVKIELMDLIGKLPADCRSPIGAVRVHDDQLITPAR